MYIHTGKQKRTLCDCLYLQLEHINYDSLNKNLLGAIWCGTGEFGPVVLYPDISPSNNDKIINMHLFFFTLQMSFCFCSSASSNCRNILQQLSWS